jgi:Mrp family chromosome partitioning ATPase
VGCTTVALALALAGAREHATAIIDGDLENRILSTYLGGAVEFGWDDAVLDGYSLEKTVQQHERTPGVAILPLRQPTLQPAGLFAQFGKKENRNSLRENYALIVVDGGPVWDSGVNWAPWVDVAMVVCDSEQKLAEDWAPGWDVLEESGAQVVGIVETFV